MATALDIIKGALRNLGVVGRGSTLSSEDSAQALEALNQLLGTLQAENLMVVSRTRESFTIAASQASYTIGSGGDFDTDRPEAIEAMTFTRNGVDYPVVPMTLPEYNAVPDKTVSEIPERFYYEPSYSLGKVYFDLQPVAGDTLTMDSLKPFTAFSALTTTVSLPTQYERMLKFGLAIDLAGEYGKGNSVPATVINGFGEAKQAIKNRNAAHRVPILGVDQGLRTSGHGYSIWTD